MLKFIHDNAEASKLRGSPSSRSSLLEADIVKYLQWVSK